MDTAYAAIVLAGGAARRLAGAAKPALAVAGVPMLHRVLAAVSDASVQVVVGPPTLPVPAGVDRTQESPPGAGPIGAAGAGLALVPATIGQVALLAADLPLLTTDAVRQLRQAAEASGADGAVYVDEHGWPQWLCGVWRVEPLSRVVAAADANAAVRHVLGGLSVHQVRSSVQPPPWYDCDTPEQVHQAQEWMR